MELGIEKLTSNLAVALQDWTNHCESVGHGDPVTVCGLDRSNLSRALESMFFVEEIDHVSASGHGPVEFTSFERLNTGTLRNSFYPEIFLRHSAFEKYSLNLELTGSFALKIEVAAPGKPVTTLVERTIAAPRQNTEVSEDAQASYEVDIDVDLRRDIPKNARIFWQATALEDGALLHRSAWRGMAPKKADARMMVVLRTFGRTADILALLEAAQEQAGTDSGYAKMLRNTFFMVLDTSTGVETEDYVNLEHLDRINTFVFRGPNLGGGGNMSQALLAVEDAVEASGVEIGELLLLDDDLLVSLESLRRHWASTMYRTDGTVFTLPVFMKSDPRRMWEDGAFWGRFLGTDTLSSRNTIAPRLLRHSLVFNGFDHLDEMARPHYPEYCTFIFLSLPYSGFRKLGYPAAFFLRGDDIEYSLRNRAAGGRTMSNPNLVAWHEPAHSYAQEYMSIAHCMMINMAYGQEEMDEFLRFFQQRASAHLSVGDALGLELYAEVLRDVLSCEVFLETGFAEHYKQKLQSFKSFDALFEYIPEEVTHSFTVGAERAGMVAGRYNFLYMPVEGRPNLDRVVLENPHTETRYAYRPSDIANQIRVNRAAADLFGLVDQFAREFENVRHHYVKRLKATAEKEFWQAEMDSLPAPELIYQTLAGAA